jgi:4-amino-4-deoxy-L-arabinose transferase-like glycosyltransferase
MGLALLTKPTALVFLLPFAVVWCVRGRRSLVASALQASVVVAVLLTINAPHLTRTYEVFGTPLGQGEHVTGNQRYGVDVTLENLVRDLAANVATPVGRVNDAVTRGVVRGMDGLGLQADDPVDTFAGQPFAVSFDVQEDVTPNLAQLGLLLLVAGGLAVSRELRRHVGVYCGCLAAGLVLFCSLFAWQPWGNRLLLPLFVLAAVPTGALLARLPRRALVAALALLVVASLPWALSSRYRPLVPFVPSVTNPSVLAVNREHGYFLNRPELEPGYRRAIHKVVALDARDVGLVQGLDSWEYPLWALLRGTGSTAALRDVQVVNDSASLEGAHRPDVLLCTVDCTVPPGWRRADYGSVLVSWPPAGHR